MARVIVCDKSKEMIGVMKSGKLVEGDGHCGECEITDLSTNLKDVDKVGSGSS